MSEAAAGIDSVVQAAQAADGADTEEFATDFVVTTSPREQGGFLGDACLSPATLPPTGPVRAGRFRERDSERLTACRMSRPPAPSGCAGCGVPGRRRFEHCTTGWCRGLLKFLYFIIGGRRFLWRLKAPVPSP